MITVCIPAYNQEKVIAETLDSVMAQRDAKISTLVIDDCSNDGTRDIIKKYPVTYIKNEKNIGIGNMLTKLMDTAETEYVVYLCGDDVFADSLVCHDIIEIFEIFKDVGVIDRPYYQFQNGTNEKLMIINERNLLRSSCQPSGMAFRKDKYIPTNKIFIEMPTIVKQASKKWGVYRMKRCTIGARIHAGGNTATVSSYYGDESPTANWISIIGKEYRDPQMFIQLKNRCPHLLVDEIITTVRLTPRSLIEWRFYVCALIALLIPRFLLQKLSYLYRTTVSKRLARFTKI